MRWRRPPTRRALFDAVIHNAGVGYREKRRVVTEDGLSLVFAVNVLVLTCSRR